MKGSFSLYTHLEDYVINIYKIVGISKPYELDMRTIAKRLGIKLVYWKSTFRIGNEIVLLSGTKQSEWQRFGHELCHYLIHYGHQLNMHYLFRELQEYQADHFAYHFCVPTFMLEQLQNFNIYDVMDLFNVEFEFALKRLEIYERKIINERAYC